MKLSNHGAKFIKHHEGLRLKAYRCPAGRWTIGYGHTLTAKEGMTITKSVADTLFVGDVAQAEAQIRGLLEGARVTQGQWDAIVSFTFNLGAHNLRISAFLRKIKAGDIKGAAEELNKPPKWCTSGGVLLDGLVKRRLAERALFLEGVV